jgi:hypothetical protein
MGSNRPPHFGFTGQTLFPESRSAKNLEIKAHAIPIITCHCTFECGRYQAEGVIWELKRLELKLREYQVVSSHLSQLCRVRVAIQPPKLKNEADLHVPLL